MSAMDVVYFASPAELRAWFAAQHETATELWVGFHKKATGAPSMTWPEAVDEALCAGWIDGVRKRIDAERYRKIRLRAPAFRHGGESRVVGTGYEPPAAVPVW